MRKEIPIPTSAKLINKIIERKVFINSIEIEGLNDLYEKNFTVENVNRSKISNIDDSFFKEDEKYTKKKNSINNNEEIRNDINYNKSSRKTHIPPTYEECQMLISLNNSVTETKSKRLEEEIKLKLQKSSSNDNKNQNIISTNANNKFNENESINRQYQKITNTNQISNSRSKTPNNKNNHNENINNAKQGIVIQKQINVERKIENVNNRKTIENNTHIKNKIYNSEVKIIKQNNILLTSIDDNMICLVLICSLTQ